jgi:predicted nucleic acid-binding protein
MVFKGFLDANVLLDFFLKRAGHDDAEKLIEKALERRFAAYTTPAVLHITGYWVTKAYSAAKAKQLLTSLLADIHIIDCDHQTALLALQSAMLDIEDALQYFTAIKYHMTHFISSDKPLKKAAIPQLPVYTPREFLSEIGE